MEPLNPDNDFISSLFDKHFKELQEVLNTDQIKLSVHIRPSYKFGSLMTKELRGEFSDCVRRIEEGNCDYTTILRTLWRDTKARFLKEAKSFLDEELKENLKVLEKRFLDKSDIYQKEVKNLHSHYQKALEKNAKLIIQNTSRFVGTMSLLLFPNKVEAVTNAIKSLDGPGDEEIRDSNLIYRIKSLYHLPGRSERCFDVKERQETYDNDFDNTISELWNHYSEERVDVDFRHFEAILNNHFRSLLSPSDLDDDELYFMRSEITKNVREHFSKTGNDKDKASKKFLATMSLLLFKNNAEAARKDIRTWNYFEDDKEMQDSLGDKINSKGCKTVESLKNIYECRYETALLKLLEVYTSDALGDIVSRAEEVVSSKKTLLLKNPSDDQRNKIKESAKAMQFIKETGRTPEELKNEVAPYNECVKASNFFTVLKAKKDSNQELSTLEKKLYLYYNDDDRINKIKGFMSDLNAQYKREMSVKKFDIWLKDAEYAKVQQIKANDSVSEEFANFVDLVTTRPFLLGDLNEPLEIE